MVIVSENIVISKRNLKIAVALGSLMVIQAIVYFWVLPNVEGGLYDFLTTVFKISMSITVIAWLVLFLIAGIFLLIPLGLVIGGVSAIRYGTDWVQMLGLFLFIGAIVYVVWIYQRVKKHRQEEQYWKNHEQARTERNLVKPTKDKSVLKPTNTQTFTSEELALEAEMAEAINNIGADMIYVVRLIWNDYEWILENPSTYNEPYQKSLFFGGYAPEAFDDLVKLIPNSHVDGIQLVFSAIPFPGNQLCFEKLAGEQYPIVYTLGHYRTILNDNIWGNFKPTPDKIYMMVFPSSVKLEYIVGTRFKLRIEYLRHLV